MTPEQNTLFWKSYNDCPMKFERGVELNRTHKLHLLMDAAFFYLNDLIASPKNNKKELIRHLITLLELYYIHEYENRGDLLENDLIQFLNTSLKNILEKIQPKPLPSSLAISMLIAAKGFAFQKKKTDKFKIEISNFYVEFLHHFFKSSDNIKDILQYKMEDIVSDLKIGESFLVFLLQKSDPYGENNYDFQHLLIHLVRETDLLNYFSINSHTLKYWMNNHWSDSQIPIYDYEKITESGWEFSLIAGLPILDGRFTLKIKNSNDIYQKIKDNPSKLFSFSNQENHPHLYYIDPEKIVSIWNQFDSKKINNFEDLLLMTINDSKSNYKENMIKLAFGYPDFAKKLGFNFQNTENKNDVLQSYLRKSVNEEYLDNLLNILHRHYQYNFFDIISISNNDYARAIINHLYATNHQKIDHDFFILHDNQINQFIEKYILCDENNNKTGKKPQITKDIMGYLLYQNESLMHHPIVAAFLVDNLVIQNDLLDRDPYQSIISILNSNIENRLLLKLDKKVLSMQAESGKTTAECLVEIFLGEKYSLEDVKGIFNLMDDMNILPTEKWKNIFYQQKKNIPIANIEVNML